MCSTTVRLPCNLTLGWTDHHSPLPPMLLLLFLSARVPYTLRPTLPSIFFYILLQPVECSGVATLSTLSLNTKYLIDTYSGDQRQQGQGDVQEPHGRQGWCGR